MNKKLTKEQVRGIHKYFAKYTSYESYSCSWIERLSLGRSSYEELLIFNDKDSGLSHLANTADLWEDTKKSERERRFLMILFYLASEGYDLEQLEAHA